MKEWLWIKTGNGIKYQLIYKINKLVNINTFILLISYTLILYINIIGMKS